jgi:hypothetical protein
MFLRFLVVTYVVLFLIRLFVIFFFGGWTKGTVLKEGAIFFFIELPKYIAANVYLSFFIISFAISLLVLVIKRILLG